MGMMLPGEGLSSSADSLLLIDKCVPLCSNMPAVTICSNDPNPIEAKLTQDAHGFQYLLGGPNALGDIAVSSGTVASPFDHAAAPSVHVSVLAAEFECTTELEDIEGREMLCGNTLGGPNARGDTAASLGAVASSFDFSTPCEGATVLPPPVDFEYATELEHLAACQLSPQFSQQVVEMLDRPCMVIWSITETMITDHEVMNMVLGEF